MGYKFKPNKSVAKRFKVSKTGKLKRGHSYRSHLMSARPAKKRRHLRRPAILFEGHARNMRKLMGISHFKPGAAEHERPLDETAKGAEGPGVATVAKRVPKAPAPEASPAKQAASRSARASK